MSEAYENLSPEDKCLVDATINEYLNTFKSVIDPNDKEETIQALKEELTQDKLLEGLREGFQEWNENRQAQGLDVETPCSPISMEPRERIRIGPKL